MKPTIFERGDRVYMIAPLSPVAIEDQQMEELAFAQEIKKIAPNPNLLWLNGRYVEAERANANGQQWRAGDVALKYLQPVFMPVTVMHDPRTAVGLIADTSLKLPAEDSSVPRARIDTMLGIWQHRFPEVAEEAQENYKAGSLMQSMEAISPHYECSTCGTVYQKLPQGAEREQWCEHLRGVGSEKAARILGGVTFTGTGLIFGSRGGARGAYDEAHLDVFQDEVAEYHERAHRDQGKPRRRRRKTSMDPIEISREEYAELQKRPEPGKLEDAEKRASDAIERAETAEKRVEELEASEKKLKDDLEEANQKISKSEEEAQQVQLRDERMGKLGAGFIEKLGETTKQRLTEQAKTFSDEEWQGRLEELSELLGVEVDAKGEGGSGGKEPEFSREDAARTGVGGGTGGSPNGQADPTQQRSVVAGLVGSGGGGDDK